MALRKAIEKSLRREDNEADAVEDQGMKDSVLAIASADFKENDVLDLPLTSRKRSQVDIGADYPGKPVSRKKYGKDVGALESEESEDEALSDRSLTELDDGLMGLDDDEEEVSEDDNGESEELEEESDGEEEESDEADEDVEGSARPGSDEDSTPLKVFHSAPAASAEIRKGQAVREQLRLWESLLECRIKLEPALVASNQLYQLDKMAAFLKEVKSSDSSEFDAVRTSLQEMTASLQKLQMLLGEHSEVKESKKSVSEEAEDDDDGSINSSEASGTSDKEEPSDVDQDDEEDEDEGAPPPKKQKTSTEKTLDEVYSEFSSYRDTEMDRWNEKAKVSSGRAAQKDFSAFDQSILKLIESILFDKYRLVRKTQQKRSDYVIYGKPRSETKAETEDKDDGTLLVNDRRESKKDVVYDPEIFDDGDFYQKLLRDFIEAKSSDGGLSKHERKLMELHRLRIKMKRKVDTRATKGRKLRYVVHPKLVNFMAPVMSNSFSGEAEAQLLKSLFGQAVSSTA